MTRFSIGTGLFSVLLMAASASVMAAEDAQEAAATSAPAAQQAPAAAPAASSVETAREALQQQESDVSQESNLEEVFQASEKTYSLLKSGEMSASLSLGYSYFRDDRIDLAFNSDGDLNRFLIENDAAHSWSSTLSVDYGIWNNLTASVSLPLAFKYDTEKDASVIGLGDLALGLRWQPFAVKRGAPTSTLFASVSTASGDSPYEINVNTDNATGKGYYAGTGGASISKVIDPAVLFGSVSYTMAFDATDLNQMRGGRILTEVAPGDSLSFSLGFAYALSYDLSLTASYQQSYSFQTRFEFSDGTVGLSQDSTSAVFNSSLGIRMSPTRIVNVSFGFGLTEDSPDVMLGLSMPVDFSALRK